MSWHSLHLGHSCFRKCCQSDRQDFSEVFGRPSIAQRSNHNDFDLLAASFAGFQRAKIIELRYVIKQPAC
jgi:hypothetical protein